jgi:WD40 repeat protein
MNSNNHLNSQGKSRGKFTIIIAAIAALAVLGLLLSRMDGRVVIVTAEDATATNTALPVTTTIAPSIPTLTTESTTMTSPTVTPDLSAMGETLEICKGDICVCKNGDCIPTGFSQTYVNFDPNHLSWSPDGTSFVFTACPLEVVLNNPSADCPSRTYIAQRDGSGVFEIPLQPDVDHYANPAWSPDGNWIAAMTSCGLSMVRPDGTGYRMVIPYNGLNCPWAIAWSPDSQRLAWIGGMGGAATTSTYVWVTNSDGSDAKIVFYSPEVKLIAPIAWNPSGDSVAVTLQNGKRYLIDASCQGGATGCDESSRTEIIDIPKDWLHNFHPQWN